MSAPDHSEVDKIEWRLKSCSKRLHDLAPHVGGAKQVREFNTDRRKNLLARHSIKSLKSGESVSKAEMIGRSDPIYLVELEKLAEQYEDAEKTIATWDAEHASFEACRSLLSMAKENLKVMPE